MTEVVCAVIRNSDRMILAAQRSANMPLPLKWEFPGGKVEAGETLEESLHREIMEELRISISIISALTPVEYAYPGKTIRLIPFNCELLAGKIVLKEHIQYQWLTLAQLHAPDWAAADLPVVNEIISLELPEHLL